MDSGRRVRRGLSGDACGNSGKSNQGDASQEGLEIVFAGDGKRREWKTGKIEW